MQVGAAVYVRKTVHIDLRVFISLYSAAETCSYVIILQISDYKRISNTSTVHVRFL
jgi:hypothetical protein